MLSPGSSLRDARRALNVLLSGIGVYMFMAACTTSRTAGKDGLGPVPPAMASEAGSRLKLRRIEADDGTTQFISWFDPETNTSCSFQRSREGWRCIPISNAQFGGSGEFSDADCTRPIARSAQGIPEGTTGYLVQSSTDYQGRSVTKVYRLAGESSNIYEVNYETSKCVKRKSDSLAWRVDEEVPLTAFVAAAEVTVE